MMVSMASSAHERPAPRPAPRLAGRRRILARRRVDFWLDLTILAGFTLAYSFGFTGDAIHEWLGLGLGLVMLVHLTLHWDWVVRTTRRLFTRRGHDRLIWLVNLALLFAMALCIASGIIISRVALPYLGIYMISNGWWTQLHTLTAEITLGLVPVHAALRWKWIVSVGRRVFARSSARRSR